MKMIDLSLNFKITSHSKRCSIYYCASLIATLINSALVLYVFKKNCVHIPVYSVFLYFSTELFISAVILNVELILIYSVQARLSKRNLRLISKLDYHFVMKLPNYLA